MLEINPNHYSWPNLVTGRYFSENIQLEKDKRVITFHHICFIGSKYLSISLPSNFSYQVQFKDCSFRDSRTKNLLPIKAIWSKSSHFTFESCFFQNAEIGNCLSLEIKNCPTSGLDLNNINNVLVDHWNYSITKISKCHFQESITIYSDMVTELSISDCLFRKDLSITSSTFKKLLLNSLRFENCAFILKNNYLKESGSFVDLKGMSKHSVQNNQGESLLVETISAEAFSLYRNKCNVVLKNSTLKKGKINLNREAQLRFENNVLIEPLLVEKNIDQELQFVDQNISNIQFISNNGSLLLSKVRAHTLPQLSNNNFSKIQIQGIDLSSTIWNLKVEGCRSVLISESNLEALKIQGSKVEVMEIKKCDFRLSQKVKELTNLRITDHKNSEDSELNVGAGEFVEINNSQFGKLKLAGTYPKVVASHAVELKDLYATKQVLITDFLSSRLVLADTRIEIFKLITTQDTNTQSIAACKIINSSLLSGLIHNYQLDNFILDNLISNDFKTSESTYKKLTITNCKTNWVGIGKDSNTRIKLKGWHLSELPTNSLKIHECDRVDTLIIKQEHVSSDSTSLEVNQSNFGSVCIVQKGFSLTSSKNCSYNHLKVLNYHKSDKRVEFVSDGDSIGVFKIKGLFSMISLIESTVRKTAYLVDSKIEYLEIEEAECPPSDFRINSLYIRKSEVQKLRIRKCNIKTLRLYKVTPRDMKIKDIYVETLCLDHFYQNEPKSTTFELTSINKTPRFEAGKLYLLESDLSGLRLNSCYFDSFQELYVLESKLDEIKCTATTWPPLVTSQEGKDEQFEIREACRQLKFAMANHHDKVSELQFHALEMSAYRQTVKQKKGIKLSNLTDRISLWAGNSNKFGMDWSRPFGWIILSVILHYHLILLSQYPLSSLTDHFWTCFSWGDFFLLFNPTHRFSNLTIGETNWGWTVFWNFSSKIWSAFFIYQLVAAFRKFRRN